MSRRVGVDAEGLLGVVGVVLQEAGAEGQGPLVLEVADWLDGYRRFWERSQERYGRLDDYLREARGKEEPDDQQHT